MNEQTKRGATPLLWDSRGNLTKDDQGQIYFYDRQNLLTRVENPAGTLVAGYKYDALNRRIEKDVAGGDVTRFYWHGWQTIEETDDATTPDVQRIYVWGATYIDELLQFIDSTSGTDAPYFAAHHHNFNVVAMLDTSGGVVERYDYDPYGMRYVLDADFSADADGVSDLANPIGHQGLMHDEESGLVYNRARMLHPQLGRFMQRDPLGYVDGANFYAYVKNSPLVLKDPSGESCFWPCLGALGSGLAAPAALLAVRLGCKAAKTLAGAVVCGAAVASALGALTGALVGAVGCLDCLMNEECPDEEKIDEMEEKLNDLQEQIDNLDDKYGGLVPGGV